MFCLKYIQEPCITSFLEHLYDKQIPKYYTGAVIANINNANITDNLFHPVENSAYIFGPNCYIYYKIGNNYYVDIHHIISAMKLPDNNIPSKFSNKISYIIWCRTMNGNLVARELIDLSTMGQILLSIDSEFGRVFRMEYTLYLLVIIILFYYLFMCYVLNTINRRLLTFGH